MICTSAAGAGQIVLFMRWDNQNVAKLSQQSELVLLTEKVARLEERLAALEILFSKSDDGEVLDLSQARYKLFGDDENELIESVPINSKRGRPPLMPHAQLDRQRDDLINFIEPRWPDLVRQMRRPKSLEHLLLTIKNVSPGAELNWPYLHLTENIAILWDFLVSKRYTGEPRQIAYAMAGVPQMKWRSSLDACTKRPSRLHINLPAFKDHISRNNSELLRSLIEHGTTAGNLKQLAKCCDECRRLAETPKLVGQALKEGVPLIAQLVPRRTARH